MWPGEAPDHWLGISTKPKFLYHHYVRFAKKDAVPIKFIKKSENDDGSWKGTCYEMYMTVPGLTHPWIGFYYKDKDGLTIAIAGFKYESQSICVELVV